jgi:hypothetical protein
MPKDNERNKPVDTKAGRANYADKPPVIKPRQAEGEKKLNYSDRVDKELKEKEQMRERIKRIDRGGYPRRESRTPEQKKYKRDPYGDA